MRAPESLRRLLDRLAGRAPSADDTRLLELFRNRSELKKELAAIDDERHRLLDRMKLQEGASMRIQEQMEALEAYLGRPAEGLKSLAYFQLRAVWRAASKRLQEFSAELLRQQKDRERKSQILEFERSKQVRVLEVERELAEARVLADQLQAEQKLARQRLADLRGFWHHFTRGKLEESIQARAVRIEASLTQVTDLSDRLHETQSEPPPLFEGISVEGRRAINLAVIACAESLCQQLARDGVGEAARQTTLKRLYDTAYGGEEECRALMQKAARALQQLAESREDLADVKARTDRIRRTATYRSAEDTVPLAESVQSPSPAGREPVAPNVLLEEYWEIYKALVR